MCWIFHRPVFFGFCFAIFTIFQVSVGIYISGVLTTLERQYRITSSVSGLILSTSDFASLISVILVTYLGKAWHRPRMVGFLGLMSGIGGVLSGIPHFLYPAYREGDGIVFTGNGTSSTVFVCDAERVVENCTAEDISDSGSRIHEAWALLLGQAIMGFAYGPLFPIALTYIDDQVRGTTTPYYISVLLTAGSSATLVGFGQGYLFLPLNVNWPAPPDYTKEWLGAWWFGFIVDGSILMLLSLPFFFFPKTMDVDIPDAEVPAEKLANEKENEANSELSVRDFFEALKRLGTNFVFVVLLFGTVFDLAVSASFGFFMAKFLEVQFNFPPGTSSLTVGIIVTPGALLGNFFSGLIVRKLKLSSRGCAWLIVFLNTLIMFCIPAIYFLSCPEPKYAGLNDGRISTTNPCNAECTCSPGGYEPVCGTNGLTYATPCFAGCTGQYEEETDDPAVKMKVYTGCKCSAVENATDDVFAQDAAPGKCLESCNMIYFAGIFLFLVVVLGSLSKNPLLILTMRAIGGDKTFGLGIQTLFGRALGFLPAPIYFGAAIQSTCSLERLECGVTGDCLIYNGQLFRLVFLGLFFAIEAGTLIFYFMAAVKVAKDHRQEDKESDYETKIEMQKGIQGEYNQGFIGGKEIGTQTHQSAF